MFRTEVKIPQSNFSINHSSGILTIGSCFAENIGSKLENAFFNVDINPFGVQFNPISIVDNLNRLTEGIAFSKNDLFVKDELWSSFAHSTLFSKLSAEECLFQINHRFDSARTLLKDASVLLITFGTAWVYELVESAKIVNNCHKLPASNFSRYRLDVETMVEGYKQFLLKMQSFNPNLRIVFSVSPVRHWKDGAHENTLSKSSLHLAIEQIVHFFPNCSYFPAYEILIDELRDYRFFADDMCHPSGLAVAYIWEKFSASYFDNQTIETLNELDVYRNRLNHRSIHPGSDSEKKFNKKTQEIRESLGFKYPYLKDRL